MNILQISVENANYDLGFVQLPNMMRVSFAKQAIATTAKEMDNDEQYNHLSHDEFKRELFNKLKRIFKFKRLNVDTVNV